MAFWWLWVALPDLSPLFLLSVFYILLLPECGFRWLCPAFRDWMLDVRRSMFDVPDREPSRFAAGRNGLGYWTFWRLLALVAAANRDGSRSDPELDAALPRWGAHLDTATALLRSAGFQTGLGQPQ